MAQSRGRLTVRVYEDPRDLAVIGWDEVVSAARAPVFYESAYLAAYHQFPLASIERFGYLVINESQAEFPVAVLPVALHTQADPLGWLREIEPGIEGERALLSHVWHCYDTQLVGAAERPDIAVALVTAQRALAEAWRAPWFGFVNVERDTPTAAALTSAGLAGQHLTDRFSTDLSGITDLDAYLRRLRSRPRANLTRSARRAAETGMTTTVALASDSNLDEVGELCARTTARRGSAHFYPVGTFVRFVSSLGARAYVLAVRQSGRLVAAGVCFTDELRFHTWACGVDYNVTGNASPYAVLFAQSVELAIKLGSTIFEGGRANDVFKIRHGLSARHLDAYLSRI
jgi:predicted N-acyltransferase